MGRYAQNRRRGGQSALLAVQFPLPPTPGDDFTAVRQFPTPIVATYSTPEPQAWPFMVFQMSLNGGAYVDGGGGGPGEDVEVGTATAFQDVRVRAAFSTSRDPSFRVSDYSLPILLPHI